MRIALNKKIKKPNIGILTFPVIKSGDIPLYNLIIIVGGIK